MNRAPLYVLVAVLLGVGLGLFYYKAWWLNIPTDPDTRLDLWSVEARVDFIARGGPVKVTLQLPPDDERFPYVEETLISRDYGVRTTERDGRRFAVWSIREAAGPQTLYYRFKLLAIPSRSRPPLPGSPIIQNPVYEGAQLAAAQEHVQQMLTRSADKETLVSLLLESLNEEPPSENLAALLGSHPDRETKLRVAENLLALADVPTRTIYGLKLVDERRMAPMVSWLEVHDGSALRSYDSRSADPDLPGHFLPWWAVPDKLAQGEGVTRPEVTFSIARQQEMGQFGSLRVGEGAENPVLRFSLFSLPIDTQLVYQVLVMVPLGAFFIALLRNVVGVQTFGTFMPVLIALAFRETHLLRGVLLFTLVVALGLAVRFLLERLKLLLVPRLAAVLTVVVLLMAALSVISHLLDIESGLSVALFPMVILTMTIERMSVLWEERGPGEAVKQGVGSMIAAVVVYLLLSNRHLEYLLFSFPELLLVLLAFTMLLGRYTGYRLLELPRFRAMLKEAD